MPDYKVMSENLLSRRGLSLDRLQTLLELERKGSLAKAAPGDPTRQTLYSRQLKQLSESFGVSLVQRQGRELKLTAAGRRLARIARESFGSLADFRRDCEQQPLTVTIGGGDSLLQWLLLPRLGQIQTGLPQMDLQLHNLRTDAIAEGLTESTLDLGLLREDAALPILRKARLLQLRYAIFVPRRLLRRAGKEDYREILEQTPLAGHSSGSQLTARFRQLAEAEKIRLNYRLTCESFPQACRAVQSGYYAAILPEMAQTDFDTARFTRVEWPALRAEARNICLTWYPRNLQLRPVLEKVIKVLRTALANDRLRPTAAAA
jgi:DNA-binding transcriptional LysR family regulator